MVLPRNFVLLSVEFAESHQLALVVSLRSFPPPPPPAAAAAAATSSCTSVGAEVRVVHIYVSVDHEPQAAAQHGVIVSFFVFEEGFVVLHVDSNVVSLVVEQKYRYCVAVRTLQLGLFEVEVLLREVGVQFHPVERALLASEPALFVVYHPHKVVPFGHPLLEPFEVVLQTDCFVFFVLRTFITAGTSRSDVENGLNLLPRGCCFLDPLLLLLPLTLSAPLLVKIPTAQEFFVLDLQFACFDQPPQPSASP
mmetsp:Transcript_50396/g.98781  ORF Transcript_50396/g.98781 Transcript_50396/m.98781 type:complete len:251 (-) Transcript_50396:121-873(-)